MDFPHLPRVLSKQTLDRLMAGLQASRVFYHTEQSSNNGDGWGGKGEINRAPLFITGPDSGEINKRDMAGGQAGGSQLSK